MDWISAFFFYGLVAPLGVLLVFGLLVFIHELGHYAAGRYFGVPVEDFSLGFGPALVSFTDRHGTLWAFRLLPLGGFVKFQGDANAASQPAQGKGGEQKAGMDERIDALASLALWKRAIVVAAGPFANFVLAFALLTFNYMALGVNATQPKIGKVMAESPAAMAGFLPGDTILSIDGQPISNLYAVNLALEAKLGEATQVQVRRFGSRLEDTLTFIPTSGMGRTASFDASGLVDAFELRVVSVTKESPAERMGLREGDVISRYNSTFFTSWPSFQEVMLKAAKQGRFVILSVMRDGRFLDLQGLPTLVTQRSHDGSEVLLGQLGFEPQIIRSSRRLGLLAASSTAIVEIHSNATLIFKLPGQFIAQQRTLNDLGGPVRIAEVLGTVAVNAPFLLIFIAALMSLQLGILNLLPIPVLDGGHLLLYGAEAILRRPLPPVLVDGLYRVGFVVLISFMVMVTFNDLRIRLFGF